MWKRAFAALAVTLTALFLVLTPVAKALDATDFDPTGTLGASSISSCEYENLGWILCPVLNAAATAADYGFNFITKSFTQLEVALFDRDSGAAQAGAVIRSFANVLFVVAFLVIAYSLITNRGVSNYNLKRMVPRFILAVIFVNISYYICQVMIDLSNVLGWSVQSILVDQVANKIGPSAMPVAAELGSDSSPLSQITSGITASNDLAWLLLAPLAAIVVSAVVICSVMIVVLIIRKVLVVALMVMSPLAFVAYLLPSTSDWFGKWLRLFFHTLLLFPVISLLIGAGQIVSASIIKADSKDYKIANDTQINVNGRTNQSATLYLVAAGAAVLPLVGTWYAMKLAMSVADAAGSRVARRGDLRLSREKETRSKKREEATMDNSKKSMALRGMDRMRQVAAAQENGESSSSILGKFGGAYRSRGKRSQAKTPEQAKFDNQVQQRLGEIRAIANETGQTPRDMYAQALSRYQQSVGDEMGGDGVNINSYEGIDLKASEAYLLENLGKQSAGMGVKGVSSSAVAAEQAGTPGATPPPTSAPGSQSSGADRLSGRDTAGAKANSRGDDAGAAAQSALSADAKAIPVEIVEVSASGSGRAGSAHDMSASSRAANGTGYAARGGDAGESGNAAKAKRRAAKFVAESKGDDVLAIDAATLDPSLSKQEDIKSEPPKDNKSEQ